MKFFCLVNIQTVTIIFTKIGNRFQMMEPNIFSTAGPRKLNQKPSKKSRKPKMKTENNDTENEN